MRKFVTLNLKLVLSSAPHSIACLFLSKLNKFWTKIRITIEYNAYCHKLFYCTNKVTGLETKK